MWPGGKPTWAHFTRLHQTSWHSPEGDFSWPTLCGTKSNKKQHNVCCWTQFQSEFRIIGISSLGFSLHCKYIDVITTLDHYVSLRERLRLKKYNWFFIQAYRLYIISDSFFYSITIQVIFCYLNNKKQHPNQHYGVNKKDNSNDEEVFGT